MFKEINHLEELLSEETILNWYFRSNEADVQYWETWAEENSQNAALLAEAHAFLTSFQFKEIPIEEERVNHAWDKISERISVETDFNTVSTKIVHLRKYKRWILSAAAVFILAIAGIYYFKYSNGDQNIQTTYGQITEKILPDGSSVLLNANSSIRTSSFHSGNTREVWLQGEAYFKVHKTATKDRFIVHTGKVDVVVTGTQFNVISRNHKTSVYLKEGSVYLISQRGETIHMKPGDYVELDNNDSLQFKPIKDKNVLGWQEKVMVFDNTSLKDVAQKMEEVYGVEVHVDSAIAQKAISGIMPNNDLSVLLQALEESHDFKIIRTNNTITISQR